MSEDKTKPIFGLEKIPDSEYIKILKKEISDLKVESGKDAAYILELEEKIRELSNFFRNFSKSKLDKKITQILKEKDETIKSLQRTIEKLKMTHKKDLSRIINQKITRDE